MMIDRATRLTIGVILCAVCTLGALPAAAQDPPSSGPLTVQRIDSGFMAAPDVKVTDVDGATATLAGAYGGWVIDRTLLIGGAAYFQTDHTNDTELNYGGVIVEWMTRRDATIRFGARALVGGGTATLGSDVNVALPFARFGGPTPSPAGGSTVLRRRLAVRDDFIVAEPEASLQVQLMRHLGLNVGVGYRFTGAAHGLTDRLNGVTGTLSLEIGLGE